MKEYLVFSCTVTHIHTKCTRRQLIHGSIFIEHPISSTQARDRTEDTLKTSTVCVKRYYCVRVTQINFESHPTAATRWRSVGIVQHAVSKLFAENGVVPKGLLAFRGSLYKEGAKITSGTLVYRFARQTARKNISSF